MLCTIQGLQICILSYLATLAEGPDFKRSYCTDILTSTMSDCKILIIRLLCASAHMQSQEQSLTNTRHKVAIVTIFCTVAYLLTVNNRTYSYHAAGTQNFEVAPRFLGNLCAHCS